jgi:hypothetical protein
MTTETAQHTPGPWAAPGTDGGEWVICHTDKGGKRRTLAHAYNEQNARLIAAAPELYEALAECLPTIEGGIESEGTFEAEHSIHARKLVVKIRAALAKASVPEGPSPGG